MDGSVSYRSGPVKDWEATLTPYTQRKPEPSRRPELQPSRADPAKQLTHEGLEAISTALFDV